MSTFSRTCGGATGGLIFSFPVHPAISNTAMSAANKTKFLLKVIIIAANRIFKRLDEFVRRKTNLQSRLPHNYYTLSEFYTPWFNISNALSTNNNVSLHAQPFCHLCK